MQTILDLQQSRIILDLGATHIIQAHPESQTTLNLDEILTSQVPEAVETMEVPGHILIILIPWKNPTTLELREALTTPAPETLPTAQAPKGIQNTLVPESTHTQTF